MAITSKENTVLTVPPETAAPASAAPSAPRFDETATASRPQPVALEVPVTVNGARAVEGTDKREPFSETTKTVLVFGNGAVIRLGSPVAPGQLLFLTNEKTKKEVVCQVVKSKNYKSVSGYVELEFTESVVGFWGMRFPSDRIGTQAPAPAPVATAHPAAKPNPVGSVQAVPRPLSAPVGIASKVPEVKPVQIPAAPMQADLRPTPQSRPVGGPVVTPAPSPATPIQHALPVQNALPPAPPALKQTVSPVIPSPSATSSLASSLASLLSAPELPPAAAPSKPPTSPVSAENKLQRATLPAQNSTEDLKLQAARLQEQLSSLLFNAAPGGQPASPSPVVPSIDAKAVSSVTAQALELAKPEPAPVKSAPLAKPLPAHIKSSLDTEEVKIPSWLEPLARNAAAPAPTAEPAEREKGKHSLESAAHEERSEEPLPLSAVEGLSESTFPAVGSLQPLDEPIITHERSSGGSNRGALYGAVAAGVLVVAGGAWYFLRPAEAARSTAAPAVSSPVSSSNQTTPAPSATESAAHPASLPASQNSASTSEPNSASNSIPAATAPVSNATPSRTPVNPQPLPAVRDNTRGAGTPIPAAATERISRPPVEPEPKKPALGDVHLASPTINRPTAAENDDAEAPAISSGSADANAGGMEAGLAAGNGKQPAAPEVPLPVGGDVKSAKLISSVAPVYPILAKNQHVSGDVVIDALIDINGHVTTMKVMSGPALLQQAARESVRQWKYQPATLDGKPVPMHLTVTLQFRPQ